MTHGTDKKAAAVEGKPKMSPCPGAALLAIGKAMETGERKYGHMDWKNQPVLASTYYNAVMRHLLRWWDGEDEDPESGLMPLAHAAAGIIILIDGIQNGNLVDDRGPDSSPKAKSANPNRPVPAPNWVKNTKDGANMSVGDMPTPTHMKTGETK